MAKDYSFEEYGNILRKARNEAEQDRRSLTATCLKVYNYIQSALDFLDGADSVDESVLDKYDIYDPESYDWFDTISDEEANYAYDEYERLYTDDKDVSEIIDIMDDARYLLTKLEDKLKWTEGE